MEDLCSCLQLLCLIAGPMKCKSKFFSNFSQLPISQQIFSADTCILSWPGQRRHTSPSFSDMYMRGVCAHFCIVQPPDLHPGHIQTSITRGCACGLAPGPRGVRHLKSDLLCNRRADAYRNGQHLGLSTCQQGTVLYLSGFSMGFNSLWNSLRACRQRTLRMISSQTSMRSLLALRSLRNVHVSGLLLPDLPDLCMSTPVQTRQMFTRGCDSDLHRSLHGKIWHVEGRMLHVMSGSATSASYKDK